MARRRCALVKVLAVFYLVCPANIIGLWWAVGSPLAMDTNTICRRSRRMGGRQREICKKEPELVQHVAKGAKLAIDECQYQFRDRKWNCSTQKRTLNRILKFDTREAGFIHAISSAGVLFAITRACSDGELEWCPCNMAAVGNWKWGGCGDNVDYGYKKARDFMDVRKSKKRNDVKTRIRLHNNEAGRQAIRNHMDTQCKCHGYSGSCNLKTCYRKMPRFRRVGDRIKRLFDSSIKVTGSNDGKRLLPMGADIKPPGPEDIVYTEDSPDFCRMSRRHGSLGTSGRLCNHTSHGTAGCDLLCCGRGHIEELLNLRHNCHCRFRWCCEVECEVCITSRPVYRCL